MADLLRSGAVFIHVPKCGGTWVTRVLKQMGVLRGQIGRKHSLPEHIDHIWTVHPLHYLKHWAFQPGVSQRSLRRAFKFTFVRNPLTWYESWWKFMAGDWHPWQERTWHPQRLIDDCGDDDFNAFVGNVLTKRPGYVGEMYGWYTKRGIFVGKFERLADDLISALQRAGENFSEPVIREFPRQNKSQAKLGEPSWDPALLRRVIEAEAPAIEKFGYWDHVDDFCQKRCGQPLSSIAPRVVKTGSGT